MAWCTRLGAHLCFVIQTCGNTLTRPQINGRFSRLPFTKQKDLVLFTQYE